MADSVLLFRRELGGILAAGLARFGRVDDALRGHGRLATAVDGVLGCLACLFGLPQRQKLPIFVRGLVIRRLVGGAGGLLAVVWGLSNSHLF